MCIFTCSWTVLNESPAFRKLYNFKHVFKVSFLEFALTLVHCNKETRMYPNQTRIADSFRVGLAEIPFAENRFCISSGVNFNSDRSLSCTLDILIFVNYIEQKVCIWKWISRHVLIFFYKRLNVAGFWLESFCRNKLISVIKF